MWHAAVELAVECYLRTAAFPWTERSRLVTRMRRAAASVVSNIVEAHAQSGAREFHRHLDIARGSARELEAQFALAASLGFVDEEAHARARELCARAERMLESLLRAPAGAADADRPLADAAHRPVPGAVIH